MFVVSGTAGRFSIVPLLITIGSGAGVTFDCGAEAVQDSGCLEWRPCWPTLPSSTCAWLAPSSGAETAAGAAQAPILHIQEVRAHCRRRRVSSRNLRALILHAEFKDFLESVGAKLSVVMRLAPLHYADIISAGR